ncbi:TonB-dependent receptor [Sphingobacterium alkalisoli]|uniref:TonB-dependent receptor n=1 Tax=Sphingobacterium alkalisoli TaxID=1874115 RepID=UPI001994DA27|nr:TonB-dependent receptor [Sphingobacterium alkalisoli]GGH23954.1 TonB-dependent receptor [Sphingobacterium alkalisoli]
MNQAIFFIKLTVYITGLSSFSLLAYAQELYQIKGRVLDKSGNAIVQATIILLPDRHTTLTDKEGRFSFDKLYEGTYQLRVSSVGYYPIEQDLPLKKSSSVELTMRPSEASITEVSVQERRRSVDNLIKAENSAMPVKIITRREIELMGSRRLDEVMKEQTGIAVVNDIAGGSRAVGVQIQGFSSNYVMVLIDGQPMLGRNSGNFDLSRISVTNIERIEIIKGASSCLYGSDALGGAINIITRHGAVAPQAHASFLYGTLNTIDATLEAETPFANQRGSVVFSGNYYRTDGFNTDSRYLTEESTTFPPYTNYSFQGRTRYRITKNGTVGFTGRYAARNSKMINGWSDDITIEDTQTDQDVNLSASYDHTFHSGLRSMTRYYFTRFHTAMQAQWLRQGILADAEEFGQQVHRVEQQFAYSPIRTVKFTGGLGGSIEIMDNQDLDEERSLNTAFAFLQTEWKPIDGILTTLGLRYDYTNVYDGRLSPSFGLQYHISPTLLAKAGVGAGFKAPDYKMRYQVFYNPAANYLVVGSDRIADVIQAMENSGELSFKNSYMLNLVSGNLQAEKSLSNNVGLVWNPNSKWQSEVSAFYHRINNQINTIIVGGTTSFSTVYSYRNLPKAVNKGFEVSTTYQATVNLQLSAGYQYLIAKDLSVLDSIRAGGWPYNQTINNPVTGESREPTVADYWGIEDRSRHMLNLKALYEYRPWEINFNLRANIRGKYPFQETTSNQFIDEYDEFVPDHVLLNLTIEKNLWNRKLTLRLIADNLLNFTHRNMLGQPGRIILGGLSYRWMKE